MQKEWATLLSHQPSESTLGSPNRLVRSIIHSHLAGMSAPPIYENDILAEIPGPMADYCR